MSYLKLSGVEKTFGDVRVIRGIDLDIQPGEFIVFVGPSGCGKSTLLRLIAGLEGIDGGSLHLDGRDITHQPSSKRDLAMVFQSYALYPHMSVFENMSFALKLANVDPGVIKDKVDRAAKILNLTNYLERTPKELSGGQRQRVAIGRAIVRAPKVFLFDEPLSNLDAKLRRKVRQEIRDLQQSLGLTVIYVTHDQEEALAVSDTIVVMNNAVVAQAGSPRELYERPRSRFVADFIGEANVLAGQVIENAGGRIRVALGQTVLEWSAPHPSHATGQKAHVAIRPSRVRVHASAPAGASTTLPGQLLKVSYLGEHMEYLVQTEWGELLVSQAETANDPTAGQSVVLSVDAASVVLLED